MNRKKINHIIKAFTEKLPVEEKWYQDRLEICKTCPLNSENSEKLSFEDKTITKTVCGGKPICTVCKCCIDRKASIKAESCGLIEKPELGEPKWDALEIEGSSKDSNIIVECLKEQGHKFTYDSSGKQDFFEVEFESSEVITEIPFRISRTGRNFEVSEVTASCGCTTNDAVKNEDGTVDVKFSISLKRFETGRTSIKTAKVVYIVGGRTSKEIFFKFKITKNG